MAYELTVDGYTFDNPPTGYSKSIDLANTPQPHFERESVPFFRSDAQDITLEVNGRLNINDSGDLTELEKLQEKAINNGDVEIDFDPFYSGTGVIADNPFKQESQRSTYQFTFQINAESTDASAYPTHATPTTGNTFEYGGFDFGFDPQSVEETYERQTEKVERLQGINQTEDNKGLITRVTLEGRIDGGGQNLLWEKARSNALAYLSAEFQNGWALLDRLRVSDDDATPDYLQGLFRYQADFLIVKDPSSGIGEVSKFLDHDVRDLGTYTADSDSGAGTDEGGLDFKVRGGTGSLDGEFVEWVVTTLTLTDNATNYVYVYDGDGDGIGDVQYNTNSFGTAVIPLYEVDTSNGEIVDIRDVRDSLIGEDTDTANSDLLFSESFAIDDTQFSFSRILALADAVADPTLVEDYLGIAQLSETIADPNDSALSALGKATFSETFTVQDGGSATGATGNTGVDATTDVTLNGETVEITVYEDTDQDGVADNSETFQPPDGTSTRELSNLAAGSGNDYWVDISLSTTSAETSPTVNSVSLDVGASGDDADQNSNTTWEIQGAKYDTSGNEYEGGGVVAKYGQ